MDSNGWPMSDAQSLWEFIQNFVIFGVFVTGCIFDDRPAFAWAPPEDDPDSHQPLEGGIYKLTLTGNAELSGSGSQVCVSDFCTLRKHLQNLKLDKNHESKLQSDKQYS